MHDRDKETEQLNNDELAECKSLSRDAEAGSFTLEDILAEYGTRRSTQRSAVPVPSPAPTTKDPGKVEKQLRACLPPEESNDFCHRLVLHGRAVCIARRPQCEGCTLRPWCDHFAKNGGQRP